MSGEPKSGDSVSATYEAPKVTAETLDAGGNYVSPPEKSGAFSASSAGAGTLGTSIVH